MRKQTAGNGKHSLRSVRFLFISAAMLASSAPASAQASSTAPAAKPDSPSTQDSAARNAAERKKRFEEARNQLENKSNLQPTKQSAPKEILQNALAAQLEVRSLRIDHTDVNSWAKRRLLIEWTPGRTHTTPLEQRPLGILREHERFEQIEIGPATYTKLPNGSWTESDYAGRVTNQPNIRHDVASFVGLGNGAFQGTDVLDGLPTLLFKAGNDLQPDGYAGFYVKIWIGGDGLPRQVEKISGDWKTIDKYFDYNASIDIRSPQ